MARMACLLLFVLAIPSIPACHAPLSGVATGVSDCPAERSSTDPEALIDQLADSRMITGISSDADRKAKVRVDRATEQLTRLGTAAFPALIAHRDDQRYSHTIIRAFSGSRSGKESPLRSIDYTVGGTCVDIIARQLNPGDEYPDRDFIPACVPPAKLPNWWAARSSKSLVDLQKEAVQWRIENEKKCVGSDGVLPEDAKYRLERLEAKYRSLTLEKSANTEPPQSPAARDHLR